METSVSIFLTELSAFVDFYLIGMKVKNKVKPLQKRAKNQIILTKKGLPKLTALFA